jgi:hypothetical protein
MYNYVCMCIREKPINKKKTPSGNVPRMGTGGSCCYDIRANSNVFLSFPKAVRSSGAKRRGYVKSLYQQ